MKSIKPQAKLLQETLRERLEERGENDGQGCPNCGGCGWMSVTRGTEMGVVRCACLTEKIRKERTAKIPERFRHCSLENYKAKNKVQHTAVELLCENPFRSCAFLGDHRQGKTHLLVAQYRIVSAQGMRCEFLTTPDILLDLRQAKLDAQHHSVLHTVRDPSLAAFHLFWDDVEKFKVSDFSDEALFQLLRVMYDRGFSISLTSNFNFIQLEEKLDRAIVRRLDEMCQHVLEFKSNQAAVVQTSLRQAGER
ncbi:MAG TPA: ATP-binding protein [Terriglobia bacterium]|nr:ATP-binding protein [Terriglobia bacterium]